MFLKKDFRGGKAHGLNARSLMSPNYLTRNPLDRALEKHTRSLGMSFGNPKSTVLDLGSGSRYYENLFNNERYIALDITSQSQPDIISIGEALPFKDASIDIVICVQVLEHVDQPNKVISEISRVLSHKGIVLLTTHGTMFYHPTPQDHWRWTHTGLSKIFNDNGEFEFIEVEPLQGTFCTLGFFSAWYVHLFLTKLAKPLGIGRFIIQPIKVLLIVFINLFSQLMDRLFPSLSHIENSNTLFGLFLVRAARTSIDSLK